MIRSPFVARESEVAHLESALERAAAGDPSLVLVGADAGVGKSRLLAHVASLAAGRGATAVTTYCVDLGEVGLPYLPFAEALGQLHGLPDARAAVEKVAGTRPAIARLLPGVGATQAPIEDEASRLQLFDGIAATLAAVGAPGRPLLLVIEDLHWADPSSRDVLRYLVARMRREHVLVVGSYRTDDLHRTHPLRPFLGEMWRHPRVERLDVAPFTPTELRAFAAAVHGRPLSEHALNSVLERSEGNAYFAEELIEAGSGTTALPWSLGEVLRSRLERVDARVQQLTRIASVAGRTVSEPLLRAVAEQHCDDADVDGLLRDAVAAHLLGWEDGRVAFRHALLAEVVHEDLLPGERVRLHRAFRDAIAADPSLASPARLAHHAQECHDMPTALAASVAAADEAWQVLAPAEELRHLETVLGLWDSVPDAATLAGADRVDVLDRAASAASRLGDLDRAVALMRDAVASAPPDRAPRLRVTLARRLLLAVGPRGQQVVDGDGRGARGAVRGEQLEDPRANPLPGECVHDVQPEVLGAEQVGPGLGGERVSDDRAVRARLGVEVHEDGRTLHDLGACALPDDLERALLHRQRRLVRELRGRAGLAGHGDLVGRGGRIGAAREQHGRGEDDDDASHIDSISRSTRSSAARKGSLHSTVRCARSLSLRWTQSTV